jgi:aminoglycoside phosphotransferase (APT) family kinase protein
VSEEPTERELLALAQEMLAGAGASVPVERLEPIKTGKHNRSFWVHTSGDTYVLRIAPADEVRMLFYEKRMMLQEPGLHKLIRSRTRVPAPAIVASDFGRAKIDRDVVLLEAAGGRPMSDVDLTVTQHDSVLRAVGSHLRALHSLTASGCLGIQGFGYLGEHRPMPPMPTWRDTFVNMWGKLLDDVVASGCYTPEEADDLRRLLDRHLGCFEHKVEPRLLHMDVWAENVLVDEQGQVTALIDFDRALWGDPEIEFAVLDYTGFSGPAFWHGYGGPRELRGRPASGSASTSSTNCRSTCRSRCGEARARKPPHGTADRASPLPLRSADTDGTRLELRRYPLPEVKQ